ncbi:MAG: NAD-dependent epimerase/dehydratase family protein [Bacteroidetes bacterium]|nr:NAD-dependent epimerase/dehydratase family protein [Bacteroidota bacterium]
MSVEEKIKQLNGPIFVFGASGFIGANLFDTIFKVRKDCFAITHDSTKAWRLKLLNVPFGNIIHCDILSSLSVTKAFNEYQPKTIFNLAAYGAYSKQSNVGLIYDTNVIGTVNVLENCTSEITYVHAGSSSEYGYNSAAPTEKDEVMPNSHYAVSKVSASYLVQFYSKVHHIPTVNLRLYSIYGDWEEPDRLIPRLIENVRQKKLPPFVSPDISRDFVYISDAVEAFICAANNINRETSGKSFNIASGEKITMRDLVDTAIKTFAVNTVPVWGSMENRKWDLAEWYGNPSQANLLLHWKAKVSLVDGLRKTYEWQEKINYENEIIPAFEKPQLNPVISAIIACYKDAQAIPFMYERLVKTFNDVKVRYEIIFVNDCSPDNTLEVLEEICNKDSNVVAITHSRNFGSQSAFLSGMEIATGDAVVLMDGDLQDPPEVIPAFIKKWQEGYDIVYGRRVKRETSLLLNFFYKLFYRLFSKLSYVKIPLDAGDFSLINRKAVKQLVALPETDQFLRGLRAWVGFKQTGVDYVRPERMFGVSTNNWRKNFWWAKKAIFSFSFAPLEFMSYLGFICTAVAFVAAIFQIIARLLYPNIPHGITTIIVLVLFFGGVQLLAMSFIGEYISKIFEETKKRPKFIRTTIRKGDKRYNTNEEINTFISQQLKND